jgi:hypothetical protein
MLSQDNLNNLKLNPNQSNIDKLVSKISNKNMLRPQYVLSYDKIGKSDPTEYNKKKKERILYYNNDYDIVFFDGKTHCRYN